MTKYWLVQQIFFFFAAVTLPTATGGGKIPRSQKGKSISMTFDHFKKFTKQFVQVHS